MTARAFILIELLAVLVLMALAATVLAGSLAAAPGSAAIDPVHLLASVDRAARAEARSAGTAVLEAGAKNLLVRGRQGVCIRRRLPAHTTIDIGHPISYDPAGRSAPYTAVIEWSGRRTVWSVSGTTGWITREHEE